MTPMNKLRKQHEEILIIVNRISDGLETKKETELLDLIDNLGVLLEEHLLLEDDFLYPALKRRTKEGIRDVATLFSIELGGIRDAFSKYSSKWSSSGVIGQSRIYFTSETKALLTALRRRIAKEDKDLFPLVEA